VVVAPGANLTSGAVSSVVELPLPTAVPALPAVPVLPAVPALPTVPALPAFVALPTMPFPVPGLIPPLPRIPSAAIAAVPLPPEATGPWSGPALVALSEAAITTIALGPITSASAAPDLRVSTPFAGPRRARPVSAGSRPNRLAVRKTLPGRPAARQALAALGTPGVRGVVATANTVSKGAHDAGPDAKPAPRWRAPSRPAPTQETAPSGTSASAATGSGGSSGGGIPIFLALPFLAAMLDLARRVMLDRVTLPSGSRGRVPERPG
jgi:hypothetical protein